MVLHKLYHLLFPYDKAMTNLKSSLRVQTGSVPFHVPSLWQRLVSPPTRLKPVPQEYWAREPGVLPVSSTVPSLGLGKVGHRIVPTRKWYK